LGGKTFANPAGLGGLNKGFSPSPSLKPVRKAQPSQPKTGGTLDLKVGYNVAHDRFGKGKVIKLEGNGPDKKATIFFPKHGSKTVLLRFANLSIEE
jgi:DNA helicase-2/ATP-dependent DNA helicase PcrA